MESVALADDGRQASCPSIRRRTSPLRCRPVRAYGSYSGLPILLQFDGFGNLQGIPGYCVNPVDNSVEDCNVSGASYVPMFSLPDGTTMTLPSLSGSTTTPLIVKALSGVDSA